MSIKTAVGDLIKECEFILSGKGSQFTEVKNLALYKEKFATSSPDAFIADFRRVAAENLDHIKKTNGEWLSAEHSISFSVHKDSFTKKQREAAKKISIEVGHIYSDATCNAMIIKNHDDNITEKTKLSKKSERTLRCPMLLNIKSLRCLYYSTTEALQEKIGSILYELEMSMGYTKYTYTPPEGGILDGAGDMLKQLIGRDDIIVNGESHPLTTESFSNLAKQAFKNPELRTMVKGVVSTISNSKKGQSAKEIAETAQNNSQFEKLCDYGNTFVEENGLGGFVENLRSMIHGKEGGNETNELDVAVKNTENTDTKTE